jgi:hypothetical protein
MAETIGFSMEFTNNVLRDLFELEEELKKVRKEFNLAGDAKEKFAKRNEMEGLNDAIKDTRKELRQQKKEVKAVEGSL